ncbi:MAG: hypothetical protein P8L18_03950 [Verrucomicrobiota bacterium]|jgi:hypothetical protein|nr:hypothetical protein [Verrucomicrobiota bacterium]
MKSFSLLSVLPIAALTLALAGCGGGDDATPEPDPAPVVEQESASSSKSTKKKSAPKPTRSVMSRIDDLLDRGNYMGAVNLAIKSGKTRAENEEYMRNVQGALGDPMARGDAKAMEAYKKMNAFFIMQNQRRR